MKKIITSIVGTGRQANAWANLLKQNGNFILKNVLSRDQNRSLDFSNRHKCKLASNEKEISQDREISLVIITSDPSRNILAVEMAKSKKNMILEKPLSLNLDETKLIFSECKKNNVICAAGLNRHYDTFFPTVEKYIQTLGNCFHAEYKKYLKGDKNDEQFSLNKTKKNGGLFLGGLVHQFDQANKLFGQPSSLIATEFDSTSEGVVVDTNVLVKYKNKISFNFSKKLDCEYNFGELMTLYCKKGIIDINFNIQKISVISNPLNTNYSRAILSRFKSNLLLRKKLMKFDRRKIIFSETFWQGGQKDILENFIKVFNGQKDIDLVNIEHNYLSTKMALSCLDSIEKKNWVQI